tara:strand:- start:7404 stop:7652 length:249 start_codon:yes stop_codon:yes gene_type:complete
MPGKNGTSIAKLKNADGKTIGWAVLWENSGLAVLWLGDNYDPVEIDPPLSVDMLKAAKAVCADSVTELLERLSTVQRARPKD